jgi:antirestriction protein ArdC
LSRKQHPMRTDTYQRITHKIVAELEKSVGPWSQPWNPEHIPTRIMRALPGYRNPYRGVLLVNVEVKVEATDRKHDPPEWVQFRDAPLLKPDEHRWEKPTLIICPVKILRDPDPRRGQTRENTIPFRKYWAVFHAPRTDDVQRVERAEAFFAATGARVRHSGKIAVYDRHFDLVKMPPFQSFRDAESYYAALAHEIMHWTGHPSRLDHDFRRQFGDEDLAIEELVAELGSAFLCADLNLGTELRPDHVAYIGNVMKRLKDDKQAIFTAASYAERAVEFLHELQKPSANANAIA